MARGGGRRGNFRRTRGGGSFRRDNSRFRDFDRDKFRGRDNDRDGPRGGQRSGFRRRNRDDRDDRGDRGDRFERRDRGGRRGGRRGDRRGGRGRGNDIEGRLDNYWKGHNKTARNDVEISLDLDEYWKQGKQKQNEAKKDDKTNGDAKPKTIDTGKTADAAPEL